MKNVFTPMIVGANTNKRKLNLKRKNYYDCSNYSYNPSLCEDEDYLMFPDFGIAPDKKVYTAPVRVNVNHVYICDEITDAPEYLQICKALNTATENDQFVFHINSPGGDLWTAIQIIHAIATSPAVCTASIEGICASAATMICIACEGWEASQLSCFMVHAPTMGMYGKFNEIMTQTSFDKTYHENLFRKVYKDFLTEDEIQQCLSGKDYWFTADETIERLQHVLAERRKAVAEAETECDGDCCCESDTPKTTLASEEVKVDVEEETEKKSKSKRSKKAKPTDVVETKKEDNTTEPIA